MRESERFSALTEGGSMLEVDGSFGEGGGQILRTAVALSAIAGIDIRVVNIRAKRPEPGLKKQHLTGILAAAKICNAVVEGASVGSTEVVFKPGSIRGGRYEFDVGTAGSVTLVLQTLLPIAAFADSPVTIEVRGGTDVPWSPPIDYLRYVVKPHLERLGYIFRVELVRRGHYPRGGGVVRVTVDKPPKSFKSVNVVSAGPLKKVEGISHCVKLPKHVAERQARAVVEELRKHRVGASVDVVLEWYEPEKDYHLGPGSGVVLWAQTENSVLGADSLGERGKPAEVVGAEAASKLLEELATGMAYDRHMADILVPYLALARGVSLIGISKLTLHVYTNLWLVKQVLKTDVEYSENLEKPAVVKIAPRHPL
ncbi:MAG: RNA 3'-terminal phosphate cyclase [Sulfolobales archaeon]|nr:RNA 3'-terminal phosphate cyclase [Sulfolobales archaeon]MDW8083012.1 RNA 3'-terminal phosphate cyclase [Sulfolobales archaeon]